MQKCINIIIKEKRDFFFPIPRMAKWQERAGERGGRVLRSALPAHRVQDSISP